MKLRITLTTLVLALAACGDVPRCPANITWRAATGSTLEQGVASYANDHLGDQVGTGECAELPDQALRGLGARSFDALGPTDLDADYVWGEPILTFDLDGGATSADALMPGDVLQYRNFKQTTQQDNTITTASADHHTSVVQAISTDGQDLCVYEQNVAGRRTVGFGWIHLPGMTDGTIWAYRPER